VNNLAVLHRRDAFEIAPERRRHLVRMWCRSGTLGWEIPEVLKGVCGWDDAFGENGEEREEVWHIEPMPGGYFPLRRYGN